MPDLTREAITTQVVATIAEIFDLPVGDVQLDKQIRRHLFRGQPIVSDVTMGLVRNGMIALIDRLKGTGVDRAIPIPNWDQQQMYTPNDWVGYICRRLGI